MNQQPAFDVTSRQNILFQAQKSRCGHFLPFARIYMGNLNLIDIVINILDSGMKKETRIYFYQGIKKSSTKVSPARSSGKELT